MSKAETRMIGALLAFACAWLSFVAGWWGAALVHAQVEAVPVTAVIVSAFAGLVTGIVLDVLFLPRWIRGFYSAPLWLLALLHGALCVPAVATFMGLPVGTFALGLVAGAYAGRRQLHNPSGDDGGRTLRRAAFFAALLTAGAALPIGLLALQEQSVSDLFENMLGVESRGAGVVVVCLLCLALFGAQYRCSLKVGRLALKLGAGTAHR